MRCLILGGTGFLGAAIAAALVRRRHDVTVMSRGLAAIGSIAGTQHVRADRHGDLSGLAKHRFDWVFDTCAYAPDAVERLLGALSPVPIRYVIVSSLSVYGTYDAPGLTEAAQAPDASEADLALAAAVAPEKRASAEAYGASYGRLKRACEIAAEARLGERATALRVGLLVGAGDYTDRLTWWVRRMDEAAGPRRRMPVPGPAGRPVQLIDVRDAAAFALRCAEDGIGGPWNVTGAPMPFSDLLGAIRNATGSQAEIVPVEAAAVTAAGIAPWTEVPLMPPPVPAFRHFFEVDCARARAAGLGARPLAETLEPLAAWDRGRRDVALRCGMSAEQEAKLLEAAEAG